MNICVIKMFFFFLSPNSVVYLSIEVIISVKMNHQNSKIDAWSISLGRDEDWISTNRNHFWQSLLMLFIPENTFMFTAKLLCFWFAFYFCFCFIFSYFVLINMQYYYEWPLRSLSKSNRLFNFRLFAHSGEKKKQNIGKTIQMLY